MPTVLANVEGNLAMMEITEEELHFLLAKREETFKKVKRDNYIAELNDLIERARADGITLINDEGYYINGARPEKNADVEKLNTIWLYN